MLLSKQLLILVFSQATLFSDPGQSMQKDISAIVKTTVQNIKNGRDAQALNLIDVDGMCRFLLDGYHGSVTNAQQAEFTRLFQSSLTGYIFAQLRNTFKEAGTITYGTPEIENDKASVLAFFKILHPMKNQENRVTFALTKTKKGWRIIDFTYVGENSILTNLRNDKIRPLLNAGGFEHMLNELRKEQ